MHKHITALLVAALVGPSAWAADHEVVQRGNEFSVKSIKVKVGDAVGFMNEDPHFHNVFSLSDAKSFDLGSYPKGQSRKVVFDKPGQVEIECAIHPKMKMTVDVAK